MTGLGFALLLLLSSAQAGAPAAAPPPEGAGEGSGERVICRSETVLNSRIRARRICLTAREWAERQTTAGESHKYITERSGLGCARTDVSCK